MGKPKSSGSSYTSKGLHSNVNQKTLNAMKADRDPSEKWINIMKAYLKEQNPWMTIPNPNKEETRARFIRVRANDKLGHPKERQKNMYRMK